MQTRPLWKRPALYAGVLVPVLAGVGGYWLLGALKDAGPSAVETRDASEAPSALAEAPTASEAPAAAAPELPALPATRTVFFGFDDAALGGDAPEVLAAWARRLEADRGMTLTIEGHCDERGTQAYNHALGLRRAEAAKAWLVARGIDAARLTVVSFGETRPAAQGSSESAWAENRRVELKPVEALSSR